MSANCQGTFFISEQKKLTSIISKPDFDFKTFKFSILKLLISADSQQYLVFYLVNLIMKINFRELCRIIKRNNCENYKFSELKDPYHLP
jgi:hypothetical protein